MHSRLFKGIGFSIEKFFKYLDKSLSSYMSIKRQT